MGAFRPIHNSSSGSQITAKISIGRWQDMSVHSFVQRHDGSRDGSIDRAELNAFVARVVSPEEVKEK
jgi:hypothetical protein